MREKGSTTKCGGLGIVRGTPATLNLCTAEVVKHRAVSKSSSCGRPDRGDTRTRRALRAADTLEEPRLCRRGDDYAGAGHWSFDGDLQRDRQRTDGAVSV